MFGLNGIEIIILAIVGFLIFGGKNLPALARRLGKGFQGLQEIVRDSKASLEGNDDTEPVPPLRNPVENMNSSQGEDFPPLDKPLNDEKSPCSIMSFEDRIMKLPDLTKEERDAMIGELRKEDGKRLEI